MSQKIKEKPFIDIWDIPKKTNKDVYRAPLALNEVTQVGKYLLENEYMKDSISATSRNNKHATQEVPSSSAIQTNEVTSMSGSDNVSDTLPILANSSENDSDNVSDRLPILANCSENDLVSTTKPVRKA